MSAASPAPTDRALTRMLFLMAMAAFASGASLRVSDQLLPQVALDFGTTVGAASSIVTAYAIPYGVMQAFSGAIGDRLGKCQAVALACAVSFVLVLLCAAAQSVPQLTLARLFAAPGAAIIVPLGMAYVGDVVPYERRQTALARFLAGQMAGMVVGQLIGGIFGDHFGWRSAFVVLAVIFGAAAIALASQFRSNPWAKPVSHEGGARPRMIPTYRQLLADRWSRFLLIAVFVEGAIFFGGFTYVAASLHEYFGLSFSAIGLIAAGFGAGSIGYALFVHRIVRRFSESEMVLAGGAIVAIGFVALAASPVWYLAPAACLLLGFGYYLLHNTLQTNATQMLPAARGTAMAGFSSALFIGQSVGVATGAFVVDHAGMMQLFVVAAVTWPVLALWIAARIKRHKALAA